MALEIQYIGLQQAVNVHEQGASARSLLAFRVNALQRVRPSTELAARYRGSS